MPRLSNNQEIVQPATALNAAGGTTVVIPLLNPNWALLVSVLATLVTTSTAGNRIVEVQIKDAAGLILWAAAQGGSIVASKTTLVAVGGGLAAAAPALPLVVTLSLPDAMIVPPLSSLVFFDTAGIDVADTVAANILLSY